jgi:plastocyanin
VRLRHWWEARGKRKAWNVTIATLVAIASACGGGTATPVAPESPRPATEVSINVTATGFKPTDSVVAVGGRATFTNIDDRLHSVASNPLTTHADCPAINEVGVLVPGQSKSTGAFTEAKTCAYHDPSSEGSGQILMGTITVR